MKAIVLSCDRYSVFRNHMMLKYAALWPDHPLTFRIPYQSAKDDARLDGIRCDFRQTPLPIKASVLALLEDLDDDEWIYWCIDDNYPVSLDVPAFNAALNFISGPLDPSVSGLLLCRPAALFKSIAITYDDVLTAPWGETLIGRRTYRSIWLNQFLRVKVIRHLFSTFPDTPFPAKAMDGFARVALPECHRLFVTRQSHAVFGESTTRGKITDNCARSLIAEGLVSREVFEPANKDMLIGDIQVNPRILVNKGYEALALGWRDALRARAAKRKTAAELQSP